MDQEKPRRRTRGEGRESYVFIGVVAERLEMILTLTRDLGVNLAGVEVILDLRSRLNQMEGEVGRLMQAFRAMAADHAARTAASAGAMIVHPRGPLVRRGE